MAESRKSKRLERKRITMVVPLAQAEMLEQLALMTGMSRQAYARDALYRQMMADWQLHPSRGFMLVPNSSVYRSDAGVFRPVAQSVGGERFFVERSVGAMPKALGGDLGMFGHVVPIGLKDGLNVESVVVARSRLFPLART